MSGIFANLFGGSSNGQAGQNAATTTPAGTQPTASGQQPTAGNPAAQAAADGKMPGTDQLPVNPLDAYANLWKTDSTANEVPPSFSIDPKTLDDVSSKLNFTQGIDQELLSKATSGDASAMLQIINQVGQQSYKAALSHSSTLTDKFVGLRSQHDLKGIGAQVKSEMVSSGFSDIPNSNHPAVRTELTRIASAMQKQNPEATPEQIVQATKEYFSTVYSAMGSQGTKQESSQPAETNWDKFFE